MKKVIAAAGAFLALGLGFVALTGFGGACGHHRHPRDPAQVAAFVTEHVDDALDDLDATPEQRTRVHAVKDRLLAAGQSARAGHDSARATMLAEWKAEQPDASRLHQLVDARAEELRALAHQAVDAGVEVHGILTPEQREKVTRKAERWHR
jgi:Spy/CpxP family protein refolding chaperone